MLNISFFPGSSLNYGWFFLNLLSFYFGILSYFLTFKDTEEEEERISLIFNNDPF